jgi:hypothetical protein
MRHRILSLIVSAFAIFVLVSCSNSNGNISPVMPSGSISSDGSSLSSGNSQSDRTLEVKVVSDTFWNTSVAVDSENWIAHMDEYGRITRALGKGVNASGPYEFVDSHPDLFGIGSSEMVEKRDSVRDGMRIAIYRQGYNGIEVENSLIRLIYGRGGKLVSYGADCWANHTPSGNWYLSEKDAIERAQVNDDSKFISAQKYYYAKNGSLIPSWRVDLDNNSYSVNAMNGEILETHQNRYEWTHDGVITGGVKPFSPLDEDIPVNLYGVKVDFYQYDQYYSGGTYTNKDGVFSFNHGQQWRVRNLLFENPWFDIEEAWESGLPTFNYWDWHDASTYSETEINDYMSTPAERNMMYYGMLSHDWFQTVEPGFEMMNFQLPCFVDKYGACTAYAYCGGDPSIHFFQPYDGCTNTGQSPTIIAHEYGHIYVSKIYVNSPTGALHEANADTLGNRVFRHFMIGPDLYGPDTYRRVSNNNRMWPAPECEGETHCVGNVLAGAHWDMAENVGQELTDHLWHFSNHLNSIDFNEKAADFILLDDDDDDVTNGCPHFDEIYDAFFVHHNLAVPEITNPQTDGIVVDIFPTELPLSIPYTEGGTIDFHLRIRNLNNTPTSTQIWAAFELPNSTFYGPIIPPTVGIRSPISLTMPANGQYDFDLHQNVPAYVPINAYRYHIRVGQFVDHVNDVIMDQGTLDVQVR